MKEPFFDGFKEEEEGEVERALLTPTTTRGLVPASVLARCVAHGLEAHQRIGQGRREARHGRRKKP